jgi:hypothetical protein
VPHWQNSLTKRKENNVLNPDKMKKLESNTLFHHLTPRAKIEKENEENKHYKEKTFSLNTRTTFAQQKLCR